MTSDELTAREAELIRSYASLEQGFDYHLAISDLQCHGR